LFPAKLRGAKTMQKQFEVTTIYKKKTKLLEEYMMAVNMEEWLNLGI
jgi:hypothetical protein